MLPKGHRIRKSKEFDLIRAEGIRYKSKNFMLVVRKVSTEELAQVEQKEIRYPRFGFIVSKKIGKAVVRNKVKRWLREAIRLNLEKFPKDIEVTLIAFTEIKKSNFHDLQDELRQIMEQFRKVP